MATTIFEAGTQAPRFAPLSLEQYEAMAEAGIIPSGTPIELIDGILVYKDRSKAGADPMTVGTEHAIGVKKLSLLTSRFARLGCHLSIQMPIRIPPRSEPEPDGAVIAGKPGEYRGKHPEPPKIHAVIEVSDSSLSVDLGTKLRLYAYAGILQYIVVNLVEHRVEILTDPVPAEGIYETRTIARKNGTVTMSAGGRRSVRVRVNDLLP